MIQEDANALHIALGGERGPSVIVPQGWEKDGSLHLSMADALLGRRILVFFARPECSSEQHSFCVLRRDLESEAHRRSATDENGLNPTGSLGTILIARENGEAGAADGSASASCPLGAQCLAAADTADLARRVKARMASIASNSKMIPHSAVNVVNRLAASFHTDGDRSVARDLYKMAVDASRAAFGDTDPVTLLSMNRFASVLLDMKDLQGACRIQRVLFHVYAECLDLDDPERTLSAANLFVTLLMLGYEGEAELVFHGELKWLLDEDPEKLTEKQARIRTLLLSVNNVRPVPDPS